MCLTYYHLYGANLPTRDPHDPVHDLRPSSIPRVVNCDGCGANHGKEACPYCDRPPS